MGRRGRWKRWGRGRRVKKRSGGGEGEEKMEEEGKGEGEEKGGEQQEEQAKKFLFHCSGLC